MRFAFWTHCQVDSTTPLSNNSYFPEGFWKVPSRHDGEAGGAVEGVILDGSWRRSPRNWAGASAGAGAGGEVGPV